MSSSASTGSSASSNSSSVEAEVLDVEDNSSSEQVQFCTQCGKKISR